MSYRGALCSPGLPVAWQNGRQATDYNPQNAPPQGQLQILKATDWSWGRRSWDQTEAHWGERRRRSWEADRSTWLEEEEKELEAKQKGKWLRKQPCKEDSWFSLNNWNVYLGKEPLRPWGSLSSSYNHSVEPKLFYYDPLTLWRNKLWTHYLTTCWLLLHCPTYTCIQKPLMMPQMVENAGAGT